MPINKNLLDEAKAITETEIGSLPEETPVQGYESQCQVKKTGMGRYAMRDSKKKKKEGEDESSDESAWADVSDFTLDLVRTERYADSDNKETQYVLRVHPEKGSLVNPAAVDVVATPEDLMPKLNFDRFLLSRGRYQMWGPPAVHQRILKIVLDNPKAQHVDLKSVVGFDPRSGIWLVENGAVGAGGEIYRADEQGVIHLPTGPVRMLSPMQDEEDDNQSKRKFESELPRFNFDYKYDALLLLRQGIDLTCKVYGPQAELGWAWHLVQLFEQFYHLTSNNPLLLLHGPMGRGKTEFGKILRSIWGMTKAPPSLQEISVTGMYTRLNTMSGVPSTLEEYRPGAYDTNKQECLKNTYNRNPREVGTLDATKMKQRRIRGSYMLVGEWTPDDAALDSRLITVAVEGRHNSEIYRQLGELKKNLNALPVRILTDDYANSWANIKAAYEATVTRYRETYPSVDFRVITNYAKMVAVLSGVAPDPSREDRFGVFMVGKMTDTRESNSAVEVLKRIPALMRDDPRSWIPFGYNDKKDVFRVQASMLLSRYYTRGGTPDKGKKPIKVTEFIRYGLDAKILLPMHPPEPVMGRVTDRTRDGEEKSFVQRCFLFDLNNPLVREVAKEVIDWASQKEDNA